MLEPRWALFSSHLELQGHSPIVTVSEDAIRESGVANVVDALNQLPGFTVGGNSATGGQGTGGRATINLHGLGTNRNLVLLEGKRLPISDISGNVDVNILPDAIIEGVDAITGGASAVYGSDAMSGVVNFKTVRSLDGARAGAMYSLSDRGDARRMNASLSFGTQYAESRGNLVAAFSYAKQDPLNGSTREFFHDETPSSFIGTGTFVPSATNAPNAAVLQTLFTGDTHGHGHAPRIGGACSVAAAQPLGGRYRVLPAGDRASATGPGRRLQNAGRGGMATYQAARAFEISTGKQADGERMRRHFLRIAQN